MELVLTLKPLESGSIRASTFSLAASEERSYGVQVLGIDPTKEKEVSSVAGVMRKGRYLYKIDSQEVIIGSLLAKNLKLDIGAELTLLGQAKDGSMAAFVAPLVGIFESGVADFDRSVVQVPLEFFQENYGLSDEAHSIVLRAAILSEVENAEQELSSSFSKYLDEQQLEVLSWEELLPGLKQSIELDMAAGWLFYLSLIIVATLIVLNTFLMSILERNREFSTVMALGAKPRIMAGLVFLECLFLSLLGVLIGTFLGSLLILYFWKQGFSVPGFEEVAKMWNIPAEIYPELSAPVLTVAPCVILLASLLSVLYPALKVYLLSPLKGLREGPL